MVLLSLTASSQIFVANNNGTVAAYNSSGALLNASFITGLYAPTALAYDHGYLYTASIVGFGDTRAVIGKYTLGGTLVSAALLSGPQQYFPAALALDGQDHLFAAFNDGSVWAYDTTGAPLYASPLTMLSTYPGGMALGPNGHLYATSGFGSINEFTTGGLPVHSWNFTSLGYPGGLVVEGNFIYALGQNGQVGKLTTAGAAVNLNLFGGFLDPRGIAADQSGHLFVTDNYLNRVGEYSLTGATINANFITAGLDHPTAILVVPEPTAGFLVMLAALCFRTRHRRVLKPIC